MRRPASIFGHDETGPYIEPEQRRLVVVSPHLDDAALSLGATIARVAHAGVPVTVVTVFAGDPSSEEPAGTWDRLCGFTTAGEAARARRGEDARACKILGAEPVWLPFPYGEYGDDRSEDEVWAALEQRLAEAALVLIPGYPLTHPDHVCLTRLVAMRASASTKLGLYVEQPYAHLAAMGSGYTPRPVRTAATARIVLRSRRGRTLQRPSVPDAVAPLRDAPLHWYAARADRHDRRVKSEAAEAYTSQLNWLGPRTLQRIRLYEWGWGGEGIGLLPIELSDRYRRRGVRVCDARALVRSAGSNDDLSAMTRHCDPVVP